MLDRSAASSNHQPTWNDPWHELLFDAREIIMNPSVSAEPSQQLRGLCGAAGPKRIQSGIELGPTPPLTDAAAAGGAGLRPRVGGSFFFFD